ncbi:hypothetical protein CG716_09730 [Mycolicibacterium sphagni]|uniref:Uncharacterized protein n=1 Tax=Mycolicibacterium sphagni TaxID=1786 RepID=A0A255DXE1_9MYCO|nr:hypothetical protein CG716_09730 [Mycolicibacterium sphagni]
MGDYWWLIAPALMIVPFLGAWLEKRFGDDPADDVDAIGCPECSHEAGLDPGGNCCSAVEAIGGWVDGGCTCQNDYHWRFESVVGR